MLQTLLFFHILAVIGLFAGMAIELLAVMRLHRAASLEQVRAAVLNVPVVGPIMGLSTLLLLAMGISMIYAGQFAWSAGWINVVFALTVVLAIAGPLITGRRGEAIHAMALAAGDGAVTPEVDAARRDRLFNYMLFMSQFELIAALYIMVAKPDVVPAVTLIAAAALLGAFPAVLVLRRTSEPAQAQA